MSQSPRGNPLMGALSTGAGIFGVMGAGFVTLAVNTSASDEPTMDMQAATAAAVQELLQQQQVSNAEGLAPNALPSLGQIMTQASIIAQELQTPATDPMGTDPLGAGDVLTNATRSEPGLMESLITQGMGAAPGTSGNVGISSTASGSDTGISVDASTGGSVYSEATAVSSGAVSSGTSASSGTNSVPVDAVSSGSSYAEPTPPSPRPSTSTATTAPAQVDASTSASGSWRDDDDDDDRYEREGDDHDDNDDDHDDDDHHDDDDDDDHDDDHHDDDDD